MDLSLEGTLHTYTAVYCGVENCDDLIVIVEMEEEKLTKGKGNWKNSHEAIDDATFNNQWKKIFAAI